MKIGAILVTVMVTLSMLIGGCAIPGDQVSSPTQPGTATGKGTLQVLVTDAPPKEEVTSIMVTVESVAVHKAVAEQEREQEQQGNGGKNKQGKPQSTATSTPTSTLESPTNTAASQDEESGWLPLDILEGQETFDLLKIKGIEEVLAVTELEAGKYTQIRMTIKNVQVKLGGGNLQDATLPSGKLKFTHPFDIVAGQTTALLFDFDAEKSVNITGSNNIMVKPVIKLSMSKPKAVGTTKANVKIATSALPNGAVGVAYNATLTANGGTTPYTWSIGSGTLPAGLNLASATGVVSGTLTGSGDYTFTMKVSDSSTPAKSDTKQYTITVAASGALIITTTNVMDGVEGTAYNATVVALGGTSPYTWSVVSGNLPDGLAVSPTSGVISGIPTKKGKFDFTIKVTDSSSPANSDTQQLSIQIVGS